MLFTAEFFQPSIVEVQRQLHIKLIVLFIICILCVKPRTRVSLEKWISGRSSMICHPVWGCACVPLSSFTLLHFVCFGVLQDEVPEGSVCQEKFSDQTQLRWLQIWAYRAAIGGAPCLLCCVIFALLHCYWPLQLGAGVMAQNCHMQRFGPLHNRLIYTTSTAKNNTFQTYLDEHIHTYYKLKLKRINTNTLF